jgi:hypothetical protein
MKIATKHFDIVADYDSFGYIVTETYYIMGVSIWLQYHYAPNGLAFAKIEEAIYVMSELEDKYELTMANYKENLVLYVLLAIFTLFLINGIFD